MISVKVKISNVKVEVYMYKVSLILRRLALQYTDGEPKTNDETAAATVHKSRYGSTGATPYHS